MIHEMVYTSAERGLDPNRRGLAPIAMTPNMSPHLAKLLEGLGRYTFINKPGSPENPPAWYYLDVKIGSQQYKVLSRCADAGLDYSGRENVLSHSMATTSPSLTAAGPAWLIAQPGVMRGKWNEPPRQLEHRNTPNGQLSAGACRQWSNLFGDPGWAGMLVDAAMKGKDTWVIVPTSAPVLELIQEAQALMPPAERWKATFATFFTSLPPGVTCRWRFVLEGTAAVATARKSAGKSIIDLTRPSSPPETSAVQMARQGVEISAATPASRPGEKGPGRRKPTLTGPTSSKRGGPPQIDAALDDLEIAPPSLPGQSVHHVSRPDDSWSADITPRGKSTAGHWILHAINLLVIFTLTIALVGSNLAWLVGNQKNASEIAQRDLPPVDDESNESNAIEPENNGNKTGNDTPSDENSDDENSDNENSDNENSDDENSDDENSDDENSDDEKTRKNMGIEPNEGETQSATVPGPKLNTTLTVQINIGSHEFKEEWPKDERDEREKKLKQRFLSTDGKQWPNFDLVLDVNEVSANELNISPSETLPALYFRDGDKWYPTKTFSVNLRLPGARTPFVQTFKHQTYDLKGLMLAREDVPTVFYKNRDEQKDQLLIPIFSRHDLSKLGLSEYETEEAYHALCFSYNFSSKDGETKYTYSKAYQPHRIFNPHFKNATKSSYAEGDLTSDKRWFTDAKPIDDRLQELFNKFEKIRLRNVKNDPVIRYLTKEQALIDFSSALSVNMESAIAKVQTVKKFETDVRNDVIDQIVVDYKANTPGNEKQKEDAAKGKRKKLIEGDWLGDQYRSTLSTKRSQVANLWKKQGVKVPTEVDVVRGIAECLTDYSESLTSRNAKLVPILKGKEVVISEFGGS